MKEMILNVLDKLWRIVRIILYMLSLLIIIIPLFEDNDIAGIVIGMPGIMITLLIDIIRWGFKTKCPDCGRMFSLKIIEKIYEAAEPIFIREKCKRCNATYTWKSYTEVGKLIEISKVLFYILPFITSIVIGMCFREDGLLAVYIAYGIVMSACKLKGKSRYIYELLLFIGYGIDAYYCIYREYACRVEYKELEGSIWKFVLCCSLMLICIIYNIFRIIITTKLYNTQKNERAATKKWAHETSLDSAVESAAERVERATTYDERVRAEAALERAKSRRDSYYRK